MLSGQGANIYNVTWLKVPHPQAEVDALESNML
jgi:hypothetical protein